MGTKSTKPVLFWKEQVVTASGGVACSGCDSLLPEGAVYYFPLPIPGAKRLRSVTVRKQLDAFRREFESDNPVFCPDCMKRIYGSDLQYIAAEEDPWNFLEWWQRAEWLENRKALDKLDAMAAE
jgi:hypothetical protein